MAFPSDHLEKLKMQGLEDMKLHTRQYAKRQTHWIRNKLLTQVRETGLDSMMFLELNATG